MSRTGERPFLDLDLPDSDIRYYRDFFVPAEADALFTSLSDEVAWRQEEVRVFGKIYPQPRLTALYADNDRPYSYSNLTLHPEPFPSTLLKIKHRIEQEVGISFTSCLLNLYRHGKDSNGWHADDEPELGPDPPIASVSFGAERYFHLKHREQKDLRKKIILHHGSLLLMLGKTQHHWLHQIAKTAKPIGPRINLTFRVIQ